MRKKKNVIVDIPAIKPAGIPTVIECSINLIGEKRIKLSCGHELTGKSLPISTASIVGKTMSCNKCKKE